MTHGHDDHVHDIIWPAQREGGCSIYCPAKIVGRLQKFIEAGLELNNAIDFADFNGPPAFKIIGVEPKDSFEYVAKGKKMRIEVFNMCHSVPCVGYGVSVMKKKLRDEFKGLPGAELGKMRKEGVQIEEVLYERHFVYLGDTSIHVFKKNENVLKYPFVVVECTFLDIFDSVSKEEIEARCERDGHILWSQLEPYIQKHKDTTFCLIHFSLRYKEKEVEDFFKNVGLDNVIVLCGESRPLNYR